MDTRDGSWDIRISRCGQVSVDLEDPAALATFLVTANIKLIRAEWLGDAPDAISGTLPSNQASSGSALVSERYHVCVASTTTPTMDSAPSFDRWEYFVLKMHSTG